MATYILPVLHAIFIWWLLTGLILYIDGLPARTFKWSMLACTAAFVFCLYGLWTSAGDDTVSGVYAAFTYGLLVWSYQDLTFYLGFVTGPRKKACEPGCRGWRHFGHALGASLYHELSIIVTLGVVVALTWGQPNQVALWTYLVLWWMHESARLNVFLGVRNVSEEFLPDHMEFLKSFLNNSKTINLLFPVSVTVSTVAMVLMVLAILDPATTEVEAVGLTFVAAIMGLAILEHWFLVLPLPVTAMWNWSLRSRTPHPAVTEVEIVAGFLGAGKTTVLRQRLEHARNRAGSVALVTDCAVLSPDGTVQNTPDGKRADLPGGAVCLGLRDDLAHQVKEVIASRQPDHIFIEPSGLADLGLLVRVLNRADIRPSIKAVHLTVVIDASAFMGDYARLPEFLKAQVQARGQAEDTPAGTPVPLFIVNKADMVDAVELATVTKTLRTLNPSARIVTAVHGVPEGASGAAANDDTGAAADDLESGIGAPALPRSGALVHHHHHYHHHHYHGGGPDEAVSAKMTGGADASAETVVLDLHPWTDADQAAGADRERLTAVLEAVAGGRFGAVDRLSGTLRAGGDWVELAVSDGQASVTPCAAPRPDARARVVAVGHALDGVRLRQAFDGAGAVAVAVGEPA
ncbi:putative photosynthetic complex assembly protein PuhE [Rhodospira trueperi]|uniref:Putative photosynthetic complex assembly protein 2 n=1 Tax=Rhodospira trueperi TaxID=69960 RepID=A0A1G6ZWJ6_9PROT|nr:putative photosynthetic complex assembly protein PuhE [Rhodospira trueperi]SDE06861.1 putative photosynthetic complex assembly protein 2 [Rhodospira trueperi]